MADVYKLKVTIKGLETVIWRDIEVSSLSDVAKLGYTILAAFDAEGSHLFNIKCKGKRYEILFAVDDLGIEPVTNPIGVKLKTLGLSIGDTLHMEYDYGAGWEFEIQLLSVTEMKRGTGGHYPYMTDGQGRGILEDTFPGELIEIIEGTDNGAELPLIETSSGSPVPWDYMHFDLKVWNYLLKSDVWAIQSNYEQYE